jgi:hypothetical protein
VELEYLSLLMSAADRILGGSNECSGNDYIFGTRESRSFVLDFSREAGAEVQSAVVIVAAFGGILEESMGGGR